MLCRHRLKKKKENHDNPDRKEALTERAGTEQRSRVTTLIEGLKNIRHRRGMRREGRTLGLELWTWSRNRRGNTRRHLLARMLM